jgi:hypothetical protein
MKGGYVYLGFQPTNVIMNDSNQLNFIWMPYSNINKKGMQDYFHISKWYTFIWSAKTLLETSNIVLIFAPTSPILILNPLECKFVINKINLIIFINTSMIWKKSKILTLIPQNLVIYQTKNLCHRIEHTLFYLCSKNGAIWINIVSFVESFLIKLCIGTCKSWIIFKDI